MKKGLVFCLIFLSLVLVACSPTKGEAEETPTPPVLIGCEFVQEDETLSHALAKIENADWNSVLEVTFTDVNGKEEFHGWYANMNDYLLDARVVRPGTKICAWTGIP